MPGPPWNDDDPADADRIISNVRNLLRAIQSAAGARAPLTTADLLSWHDTLYAGCSVPVAGYRGHFRGDASVLELVDYEVRVGVAPGTASAAVTSSVNRLVAALNKATAALDAEIALGTTPNPGQITAVLTLCASAHGEWLRIHPFANGNGRVGRALVAWIALRYNLPVFLKVKPRPTGNAYVTAAQTVMTSAPNRDFAMLSVFAQMLNEALAPWLSGPPGKTPMQP